MATETEIRVTNIGPVADAAIPIDPEGGVTVVYGCNGAGKDTTLEAVARLTGGSGPLDRSDGHPTGSVAGLGAHLSVAKSTRLSGQLEAVGLSGLLDLSRFVEPPFVDPEVADRARMKALLTLRGTEAKPELFWPLFDGEAAFEAAVTLNGQGVDLVEMARLVKTGAEKTARDKEAKAERAEGQATACAGASDGLDMSAECDAKALQALLEGEIAREAAVKASAEANRTILEQAAEAEEAIAKREGEYTGPTAEAAQAEFDAAAEVVAKVRGEVERLYKQLLEAEASRDKHEVAWTTAGHVRDAAVEHETTIAAWRKTIANARLTSPVASGFLVKAAEAVTTARKAVEAGALIRDARTKAVEATKWTAKATTLRHDARSLREAGQATDSVLSEAVASDALWVEAGRLMFKHARRGVDVCFHDLSKGEKWKVAIDEAIKRIRELDAEATAIIVIPQQAWEGLDRHNRRMVHEYAKEMKVTILAGKCDGGELRAIIYDPATEPADITA